MRLECSTVILLVEHFAANGNVGLNCLSQPRGQPQSSYTMRQNIFKNRVHAFRQCALSALAWPSKPGLQLSGVRRASSVYIPIDRHAVPNPPSGQLLNARTRLYAFPRDPEPKSSIHHSLDIGSSKRAVRCAYLNSLMLTIHLNSINYIFLVLVSESHIGPLYFLYSSRRGIRIPRR